MASTPKTPAETPPNTPAAPDPLPMVISLVAIDSVRPDPANAREHNDRSLNGLTETLKEFRQQKPIVVDRDGIIRAGNGTWRAAKRLGWTHINVVKTDLDARAAALYAVADNRMSELSYFDDKALVNALQGVGGDELGALGFDQAETDALFALNDGDLEEIIAKQEKKPIKHQGDFDHTVVRLLIAVSNADIVEDALRATGEIVREEALLVICRAFLNGTRQ